MRKVGLGSPSLPLRMMTGLIQHFRTAILDVLAFSCLLLGFLSGRVF